MDGEVKRDISQNPIEKFHLPKRVGLIGCCATLGKRFGSDLADLRYGIILKRVIGDPLDMGRDSATSLHPQRRCAME